MTYEKIGTIQRRLAWPLHKDDTLSRSGRPTGLDIYVLATSRHQFKVDVGIKMRHPSQLQLHGFCSAPCMSLHTMPSKNPSDQVYRVRIPGCTNSPLISTYNTSPFRFCERIGHCFLATMVYLAALSWYAYDPRASAAIVVKPDTGNACDLQDSAIRARQ